MTRRDLMVATRLPRSSWQPSSVGYRVLMASSAARQVGPTPTPTTVLGATLPNGVRTINEYRGYNPMPTWVLRPRRQDGQPWDEHTSSRALHSDRWVGEWDTVAGFIINAPDEATARTLANTRCGVEGPLWTNTNATTCERLSSTGTYIVMRDFNAG